MLFSLNTNSENSAHYLACNWSSYLAWMKMRNITYLGCLKKIYRISCLFQLINRRFSMKRRVQEHRFHGQDRNFFLFQTFEGLSSIDWW